MIHYSISFDTVLFTPILSGRNRIPELSTIVLTCTVQANPAPVITWLIRSEAGVTVLLNSSRTSITHQYRVTDYTATSVLTIREAVLRDQGEYVCEVIDGEPRMKNHATVDVAIEGIACCIEVNFSGCRVII